MKLSSATSDFPHLKTAEAHLGFSSQTLVIFEIQSGYLDDHVIPLESRGLSQILEVTILIRT